MAKKIHVRPGKTQSKVGFVIGIIFCLIGLFVVVPTFGPFGLLWTAAAGWITYSNYRNGFTDKHISNQVIEIEEDGESVTSGTFKGGQTSEISAEERMKQLQNLYDQALITYEEYQQKRKEILEDL